MQPTLSVESVGSVSSPLVSANNNSHLAMNVHVVQESDKLYLLSKGTDQFIRIDPKTILQKFMETLGVSTAPLFNEVDCGDGSVQCTIRLDVSNLTSINGERINYSVVHGQVCQNLFLAEENAVRSAINHLEHNYAIKFIDYSSRLLKSFDSYNSHILLRDAIGAMKKVLDQWELTLCNCEKFGSLLEGLESKEKLFGEETPAGRVYAFVSDYLSVLHTTLHIRSKNLRKELNEAQLFLGRVGNSPGEEREMLSNNGPFNEVFLPSKFLLQCVLDFYGLANAEFASSLTPHGSVQTSATFFFPYMPDFKYGGNICIHGMAQGLSEAEEEAAHESLMLIEQHFKTTIIDLKYSDRKKGLKLQNKILTKLSNILELCDSVKMMFGELINAIEGQRSQFSLDPNTIFSGPLSPGQIDAYNYCFNGLTEVDEYAIKCYGACAPAFDVLNRLTWHLIDLKTKMHL